LSAGKKIFTTIKAVRGRLPPWFCLQPIYTVHLYASNHHCPSRRLPFKPPPSFDRNCSSLRSPLPRQILQQASSAASSATAPAFPRRCPTSPRLSSQHRRRSHVPPSLLASTGYTMPPTLAILASAPCPSPSPKSSRRRHSSAMPCALPARHHHVGAIPGRLASAPLQEASRPSSARGPHAPTCALLARHSRIGVPLQRPSPPTPSAPRLPHLDPAPLVVRPSLTLPRLSRDGKTPCS
jgi:hypothetical protein